MKKTAALFISMLLIFCFSVSLVGCGSKNKQSSQGETNEIESIPGLGESTTETNEIESIPGLEENTTETEDNVDVVDIDNKNPQKDSEGLYVYYVKNYELHVRTNVWDYIDGDIWSMDQMFEDLGFPLDNSTPLVGQTGGLGKAYTNFLESGDEITVLPYRKHSERDDYANGVSLYKSPNPSKPENSYHWEFINYDGECYYMNARYVNISLDAIIVCAYVCEQSKDGLDIKVFDSLFSDDYNSGVIEIDYSY